MRCRWRPNLSRLLSVEYHSAFVAANVSIPSNAEILGLPEVREFFTTMLRVAPDVNVFRHARPMYAKDYRRLLACADSGT